ncbi:MAG: restriction endonuclease subunit S [Bacillus sp. (in: Bacteria)]|nr:restriction endonuclease subunit S [Bacillus sp. (in: firmicutes)]MCM1426499.1 restriction endonuclease subunit S [Eubacterium sp.]
MGNWKMCTIADIGTVVGGATPSTKKEENYAGGTIAWITPKDLAGFTGRFISCGERNITETGLKSCSAQIMPKHTVLFSSRAPIGYIAIAANEVCTNQGFKSVIPNENVDYMFLYYLLKYNKENIENLGSGTTFKEVSAPTMREVPIRVPESLDEQKAIASILSALDDKIEKNIEINDILQQQIQLLYEDFITAIDEIPVAMSKVVEVRDGTHDSPRPCEMGYPLVTSKYLFPFGVDVISPNKISKFDYDKINERSKVDTRDILFSMIGTVGLVSLIIEDEINFAIKNVGLFKTSKCPQYTYYLFCYLRSKKITQHIEKCLAGSTQKYISLAELRKLPIIIPNAIDINKFNDLVTPLFSLIIENIKANMALTAVRDSLLPKLMSGELDVSSIDF